MSAPPASTRPSRPSSTSSGCSATQASGGSMSAIAPARLQRVDVGAREQERLAVPHGPAGALERGADADPGSAVRRHRQRLPRLRRTITRRIAPHDRRKCSAAARRLRIELDRPEAMNAVRTPQLGDDAARRRSRRPPATTRSARSCSPARAARSPPAPTSRPASTRRRRAIPDVADARCASATTRSSAGIRDDAQAGASPRSTGRPSASAARSRWPATWSLARRVGLLPAGVREHRPGARRRLVAAHPRARRLRPRGRDGDAGRARPGAARRSSGA